MKGRGNKEADTKRQKWKDEVKGVEGALGCRGSMSEERALVVCGEKGESNGERESGEGGRPLPRSSSVEWSI